MTMKSNLFLILVSIAIHASVQHGYGSNNGAAFSGSFSSSASASQASSFSSSGSYTGSGALGADHVNEIGNKFKHLIGGLAQSGVNSAPAIPNLINGFGFGGAGANGGVSGQYQNNGQSCGLGNKCGSSYSSSSSVANAGSTSGHVGLKPGQVVLEGGLQEGLKPGQVVVQGGLQEGAPGAPNTYYNAGTNGTAPQGQNNGASCSLSNKNCGSSYSSSTSAANAGSTSVHVGLKPGQVVLEGGLQEGLKPGQVVVQAGTPGAPNTYYNAGTSGTVPQGQNNGASCSFGNKNCGSSYSSAAKASVGLKPGQVVVQGGLQEGTPGAANTYYNAGTSGTVPQGQNNGASCSLGNKNCGSSYSSSTSAANAGSTAVHVGLKPGQIVLEGGLQEGLKPGQVIVQGGLQEGAPGAPNTYYNAGTSGTVPQGQNNGASCSLGNKNCGSSYSSAAKADVGQVVVQGGLQEGTLGVPNANYQNSESSGSGAKILYSNGAAFGSTNLKPGQVEISGGLQVGNPNHAQGAAGPQEGILPSYPPIGTPPPEKHLQPPSNYNPDNSQFSLPKPNHSANFNPSVNTGSNNGDGYNPDNFQFSQPRPQAGTFDNPKTVYKPQASFPGSTGTYQKGGCCKGPFPGPNGSIHDSIPASSVPAVPHPNAPAVPSSTGINYNSGGTNQQGYYPNKPAYQGNGNVYNNNQGGTGNKNNAGCCKGPFPGPNGSIHSSIPANSVPQIKENPANGWKSPSSEASTGYHSVNYGSTKGPVGTSYGQPDTIFFNGPTNLETSGSPAASSNVNAYKSASNSGTLSSGEVVAPNTLLPVDDGYATGSVVIQKGDGSVTGGHDLGGTGSYGSGGHHGGVKAAAGASSYAGSGALGLGNFFGKGGLAGGGSLGGSYSKASAFSSASSFATAGSSSYSGRVRY